MNAPVVTPPQRAGSKENDGNESINFRDMPASDKATVIVRNASVVVAMLGFLYLFICSLSLMGSAFQLLGGKEVGESLAKISVFNNPVAGVVLGMLATVLLQSSSTTTSIIISMTSVEILQVKQAIFMVMGANIGTSVTNTVVAMTQIANRGEFKRAFAGATVHDMFNFLTTLVLLPLEAATGYLLYLSTAIVDSWRLDESSKGAKQDLLKVVTDGLTSRVVQIDKASLQGIVDGTLNSSDARLLKQTCGTIFHRVACTVPTAALLPVTDNTTASTMPTNLSASLPPLRNVSNATAVTGAGCLNPEKVPCDYLFYDSSLSESVIGVILLVASLALLCASLVLMVKSLTFLLKGKLSKSAKKTVNADLPGRFAFLTGYIAILIGAGLTIIVQSSSVFTSSITPLVGIGMIDLERMYPLTLGANVGTTVTGILAALASSNIQLSMEVAMAHLFFNISGILLFYPIPALRRLPIRAARFLGSTTARYRWFAVAYLLVVFLLIPLVIFGLSLAGWKVLLGIGLPILCAIVLIVAINILQSKRPDVLPDRLKTWEFLPGWLRSLAVYDAVFARAMSKCSYCRSAELQADDDDDNAGCCKTSTSASSTPTPSKPVFVREGSTVTFAETSV